MGYVAVAGLVVVLAAGATGAAPLTIRYDDDGMITVNGQRTLIIGSYYPAKSDRPYGELADAGFNLVRTGGGAEEMDKAHAAGLMTWTSVGTLDLENREASTAKLLDKVKAIKDHPALPRRGGGGGGGGAAPRHNHLSRPIRLSRTWIRII